MKRFICFLTVLLIPILSLEAKIVETSQFRDILMEAERGALFLIDIDDTVIDSPFHIGCRQWRKYLLKAEKESRIPLHDLLSLWAAKNMSFELVQEEISCTIAELQEKNLPVLGFTARGVDEWYATEAQHIDFLTEQQTQSAGVDFSISVPLELSSLNPQFYYNGILFTAGSDKWEFFRDLISGQSYFPEKIVAIDDKLSALEALESGLRWFGIPFTGYWYRRAEKNHADFDLLASMIELERLLKHEDISDRESIKQAANDLRASGIEPNAYFFSILESVDFESMKKDLQMKF